jgi:hypothetical protein
MNSPGSATAFQPDESALRQLGRMYRFSRIRYLLLLLIPALWILGGTLVGMGHYDSLSVGILIAWFFVVLFGVGAWVFLFIPEKEELTRKYVSHVLPFLFQREGLTVDYYPSHDLSMAAFLKSGLYHDRYNTMLREDCIQGSVTRMQFSMYQVAVQTVSGHMGRYGNHSRTATNEFYGWAIHCLIAPVRGTHVILPRSRKTGDESDDWLEKVSENWSTNPRCPAQLTGYAAFDGQFVLYTDNPQAFFSFATKEFFDFLIYLSGTSGNAFALNISGGLLAFHMGHESPSFRYCPDGDFASEYHPELLQEAKWFCDLLKGIQRFTMRSA